MIIIKDIGIVRKNGDEEIIPINETRTRIRFPNITLNDGDTLYINPEVYEGMICTCSNDCPIGCTGKCGCSACCSAYGDAISELGCD